MRKSSQVFLLLTASALLAVAQNDPPGRVGRLTYLTGEVSFRPGDVDDWLSADINRPLTTGDHLWTDDGARAEVHIGTAALRLKPRTAFEFLNLDDGNVQIRLTEGSLNIHLRSLDERESFEVDTPNLAFSLLRPGDYRIDVNPDAETTLVTVRGGEGEATGGGQAFTVHAREQAQVSGGDSLSYNILRAPPLDDWDNWCLARDRREEQSQSARYVSREMVGYQDLDDYGAWREVPDYGYVWAPRSVVVGWAPYHYGHWVWVEPWGWTWVDDAPWGFAPFHYGRWVYVGYWAWVPGPVRVRPVYAPALVAWVGGPRFNLSVSFGGGGAGVAWFPLGPREVFMPGYRASNTYINRVNVTNTTIINNVNITNTYNNTNYRYVNREAPGAVTAVPQGAFGGRRVQDAAVPVRGDLIRSAQVMNTAPVAPTRASVLGGASGGRVAQPPAAAQNRAVVAKATPPPPPVPFNQRQQALAANPGRPLDSTEVDRLRTRQPAPPRSYIRPAQSQSNPGGGGGFNPGRPVQQPQQPLVQPGERRPDRPVDRSVDQPRPPQRPEVQPAERRPDRPPDRPVDQPRPPQRPEVQPAERRPDRPPDRPVDQPRPPQRPEVQPAERRPDRPPDRPVDQPRPPQRPEVQPAERRPPPPQREVQQERRQERAPEKEVRKEEKKDEKKQEDNKKKP